jgi:hypothetical protein
VTLTINPVLDVALHYVGTTLTNAGVPVPLRVTAEPQPDEGELVDWAGYTVRFIEDDTVLCDATLGSLAVQPLFDGDDTDVGSAHCLYAGFTGNRTGTNHEILAELLAPDGTVAASLDVGVLVFDGIQQTITGGGTLQMIASGGQYPALGSRKLNFGFNADSGKGNQGPGGDLTIVYDAADGTKLYQIKVQTIVSIATATPTGADPIAEFTGRGDLVDITDDANPLPVLTDVIVQVEASDGSPDTFAASVWDAAGQLLFATNWNVYELVRQEPSGGNIDIK